MLKKLCAVLCATDMISLLTMRFYIQQVEFIWYFLYIPTGFILRSFSTHLNFFLLFSESIETDIYMIFILKLIH